MEKLNILLLQRGKRRCFKHRIQFLLSLAVIYIQCVILNIMEMGLKQLIFPLREGSNHLCSHSRYQSE